MENIAFWTVFGIFVVATLALATYGLHLYVLVFLFARRSAGKRERQQRVIDDYRERTPDADWPVVTSQIPIYNEADVAVRVINAVAAMHYGNGRHEIQVLDDSTDNTRNLIDQAVKALRDQGVEVNVVRRPSRTGFKAGALTYGMERCRGQYISIFDADFVPPRDFLQRMIPLLEDGENLACIQGRWGHLNRHESWLTSAQALGIDGHFAIEQGARAWNGLMMNFNGTAGVWRKAAIDDAKVGGWSGDTLTEDLDLSYRAQLAGWRIDYCLDMECPAELPGTVPALKSQQRRWATGSIQVACKLLPSVWRAPLSLGEKIEATLHLTHYTVALWMVILALIARPILLVMADQRLYTDWAWLAWSIILVSAFAPSIVYTYARFSLGGRFSAIRTIPSMFVLGCGLCLSNAIAVVRGLFLRGGEFVRTPKSGSTGSHARRSSYRLDANALWFGELMLGIYAAFSFYVYFTDYHRAFSFFLAMYAIGFCVIGWLSRPDSLKAGGQRNEDKSPAEQVPLQHPEPTA
ncbi:MAG: glycosyltransferase [Planctomycetota bacterium]